MRCFETWETEELDELELACDESPALMTSRSSTAIASVSVDTTFCDADPVPETTTVSSPRATTAALLVIGVAWLESAVKPIDAAAVLSLLTGTQVFVASRVMLPAAGVIENLPSDPYATAKGMPAAGKAAASIAALTAAASVVPS